jgi:diguanylate cyclase (GGDEF)-like protein/PAS domain S-box-containing protein
MAFISRIDAGVRAGDPEAAASVDFLESTLDCVYMLDRAWRFTYVNRRCIEEIGAAHSLIGRHVSEIFPGSDGTIFHGHYARAMNERVSACFQAYFAPFATWYENSVTPTENGIAVCFRNITERKRVEDRLRISEERYRLASRASQDLVWDWDLTTGRVEWSGTFAAMFGCEHPAFGTDVNWWLERLHPEDRETAARNIYRVIEGGGEQFSEEYRFRRADGAYAHIHDRGFLMRGGDGRPLRMIGAMQDLTAQKHAIAALADRERQLATVFGQATVGIAQIGRDNGLMMANHRFCELLGRSEEELRCTSSLGSVTHPDDRASSIASFLAGRRSGEPYRAEKRYLKPDGTIVWCAIEVSWLRGDDGEVSSAIVVAEDVTARRVAEQELENSRALLQTVIDSVSDLIFVKDGEGRFVLANQALGRACGDLVGRRTTDFFDNDLTRGYEQIDRDVMASGGPIMTDETIPVDGVERLFETVKVPWRVDGEIRGVIGVSRDITEAKAAEHALAESEALNRSIVEASIDSIKLLDLSGTILFVNSPGLTGLERKEDALVGCHWLELWPAEVREAAEAALWKAREGGIGRFSAPRPTTCGLLKWWDVVVSPVPDEQGVPLKLVAIARDVTQHKTSEERVRWSATHDALTRLPNRLLFQERLAQAIAEAEEGGAGKVGLLHLDIDHFKQVNDSLGHDAGDMLLKTLAERLRDAVRAGDTVARLGGDEFAIVLPGISSAAHVTRVVDKILDRLKEPFVHAGRILDCRASIGASIWPDHGNSSEDLLKSADIALYMEKSNGRGGVVLFQPAMRADLQRRASMVSLARDALGKGRVLPYYQPKVDMRSGRVVGFEALLRWRDPHGRIQRPGAIAAAFEDLEVAAAISDRMLDCSIADMGRWRSQGLDFGHVALNAAAADFRRNDFAERILARLSEAGIPAYCFQLEVTETVFLGRGAEYVERALKLLSDAGATIALDDFGTGYASLRHLKQFPVDVIKIDQSFVRDLEADPDDTAIIRAVLNLGQSLGIKVVAEGIETRIQAKRLEALGCDYGQGHLYARAVSSGRVPRFLGKRA